MERNRQKILISCSTAKSLLKFRGKLIEELLKNNTVYVFTPTVEDPNLKATLIQMGIKIYENTLSRNTISVTSDLKYLRDLGKVIREVKPDVFFAYTFKPLIFGSVVASLLKVRTKVAMLTGLGYNFADEEKNMAKTITQKLLKFSLGFNKNLKIIFHNDDDRQELLKRNIIGPGSKTYVVNGSGVDLNFYTYSKPDINPIRFLLISRLIKAKGVEEFYEAASILHEKYPQVKFSVVGTFDGKQIDSIHPDLHKQITTSSWIDYTGWVDDVRPFIEKSSVVVLPSYREGTPRSILEGMSMGRAIITTDTAGCRQTVNSDQALKNGHLIKVKSVSDIVAAMESYINNPDDIVQYGLNGRAYAEQKYDVEKVNKDMLSILLPA